MAVNSELYFYAKHYKKFDFNVSCISNYVTEFNFSAKSILKSPNHDWQKFQKETQGMEELASYDWNNAVGVGAILGHNELRAIDVDGCNDLVFANELLKILELPDNYEWVVQSGSHNGFHILFYAGKMDFYPRKDSSANAYVPNKTYKGVFEKIEFLWNSHVVLPPSIHNSSLQYRFLNTKIPQQKPLSIKLKNIVNLTDKIVQRIDKPLITSLGLEKGFQLKSLGPDFQNEALKEIKKIRGKELYLIFDIETDGLPQNNKGTYLNVKNWPRIIQISWMVLDKEGFIVKRETATAIGNAKDPIEFANINLANAQKISQEIRVVLEQISEDLQEVSHIICHNLDFDLNTLRAEFLRNGIHDFSKDKICICTMKSTIELCAINNTYGYKYPSLIELYYHLFNREIIESHNSETDCLATAKCFWKLKYNNLVEFIS